MGNNNTRAGNHYHTKIHSHSQHASTSVIHTIEEVSAKIRKEYSNNCGHTSHSKICPYLFHKRSSRFPAITLPESVNRFIVYIIQYLYPCFKSGHFPPIKLIGTKTVKHIMNAKDKGSIRIPT